MESLYRKYRPQTFEDVVGQTHVVSTLERAVTEGRVSHAYLFCGPRGTGKTTMARILAKALMCEQGEGHLPDGTCEECELIAAGNHPDVYELDAASRTGVDNVRDEIISRVDYAPVRGRYKVYIIDEVHMLTPQAFNALLKTLEEPPAHVVFIMCTTDPQKILATILSRVQRFDFHAIGNQEMFDHLAHVCELEGFTAENDALDLIVRHSRGGMRDALSTLEQLSVFGNGSITADATRALLGEVSSAGMNQISIALANRDVPTLFAEVSRICDAGRDPLQFTRELAMLIRNLYVASMVGPNTSVLSASSEEARVMVEEAASYGGTDRLARILAILGDAASQMRTAPNQRLVLEIALTRAARPESDLTLESLAERVEALEKGVSAMPQSAPVAAAPAQPVAAPAAAQAPAPAAEPPAQVPASASAATAIQPAVTPAVEPVASAAPAASAPSPAAPQTAAATPASKPEVPAAPIAAQAPAQPAKPATPKAASQTAAPEASSASPAAPQAAPVHRGRINGELQRSWNSLMDDLKVSNGPCAALLMNAYAESDDGSTLVVMLPENSAFSLRLLERVDVKMTVDAAVRKYLDGPRQVVFRERAATGGSAPAAKPAFAHTPEEQARPAAASVPSQAASKPAETQSAPAQVPAPASETSAPAAAQSASAPASNPESVSTPVAKPTSASVPALVSENAPAVKPTQAPVSAQASEPIDDDDEFDSSVYDDEVPLEEYGFVEGAEDGYTDGYGAFDQLADVSQSAPATPSAPVEPMPATPAAAPAAPAATANAPAATPDAPISIDDLTSMASDIFGSTKVTVVNNQED